MKNLKRTILFTAILTLTTSAFSRVPQPLDEGSTPPSRDYYVRQMEDRQARIQMKQNERSVFIQATLNCLNRKVSEANKERIDIVLDICFNLGKTISSGHTRQFTEAFVKEMKGSIQIDDIREGRQDITKTILCVRDNTKNSLAAFRGREVDVRESDTLHLEQCGFDPIRMGTRVLPVPDNGGIDPQSMRQILQPE